LFVDCLHNNNIILFLDLWNIFLLKRMTMSQEQEQGLLSSAADTERPGHNNNNNNNTNSTDRTPDDDDDEMAANPGDANNSGNHVSSFLRKIAAVMGASGVTMGAFGAHALKETLTKKGTVAMWQTATIYQLFHAAAILSMAAAASLSSSSMSEQKAIASNHLLAGKLMGFGNLLFSGSIYCLAIDVGPKKILGPITPLGGLLMIGGWIVIGTV
jgi:uncharacterized membrane protein YgdD (TMEM256/DUF423 family)